MRRFSREKINQLARDLLAAMNRTESVELLKDRDAVLQAIAGALADEFRREEERDAAVRRRIAVAPSAPLPGTREYDDLFIRLMEEEYVREGLEG